MQIVLADPLPGKFLDFLGEDYQVLDWTATDDDRLSAVEGVLTYAHPIVDGPLMDRMPNLKVISNHGVGVDHIDVAAARERGIPVGNTPGCLDAATADMTMALLLSVARNIRIGDGYARSPEFTVYDPSVLIGREVTGGVLGIIGMGRVGGEVARRARGFDMTIFYHNRNRRPEMEEKFNARWLPLNELLSQSDFISLHCPLTDETTGLISSAEFALMKSTAIIVNMARGPVVETDALVQALLEGQIAAAGVDVTDPEPLPRDHPLLLLDNVIITPHLGSASDRTRERMMQMTALNLTAGLSGRPLPYAVD